jgi:hypothetical protein
MTRWIVIAMVMLGACSSNGSEEPSSEEPSAAPPSPTAALEDFNGEWCDAVFPLRRALDDFPTLTPDARTIESIDDSVERFDALASGLSEVGFDEVAADARQMADALNDLGDALADLEDLSVEEALTSDSIRDQGNAVGRMPIDELADSLGDC